MSSNDKVPTELAHVTLLVERGGTRYLTLNEAATYARTSTRTVRRWARRGDLRRCGPGRYIRIDREELVRLLTDSSDGSGR
ncbi:MAG: helix-turn-helix domain-containing protein [Thioalkalivibrio sp.]|nr:helix-turn-helix domain-containing protein [Thioalkalivibrio sp.]